MANVATAIAMAPTYLPYERPPDIAALWTAIPRGLRGFIVESGTLDAKPINDTQTLALSGILPANFGYVFSEISIRLSQDVAAAWASFYTLNLQNWYQGVLGLSSNWNFPFVEEEGGVAASTTRGNGFFAIDGTPRGPMWAPRGTSGIQINITVANTSAPAGIAGTISAYINFWEFDLEQLRKFPINTPLPTHSR